VTTIALYGIGMSPFVRKVCVVLREKGLAYEHIPVRPIEIPEDLLPHSPLRKIPFACIDGRWLADSSVICAYLEKLHADPALYPPDAYDCARAMWFEEFIDGGATPKLGGTIFFERIVAPQFLNRPPNEERVAKALAEDVPRIYGYLDGEIGSKQYLVADRYTIADITVASFFVNMAAADVPADPQRWPNLSRYLQQQHRRPVMASLIAQEMRTPAAKA
jgi:glutathione S-transferase